MNRTLRRAAVLLAVAGIACTPVTAIAEPQPIVFTNVNQITGGDTFNAGHSNIVGSGDGGPAAIPGLGAVAPAAERTVRIQTGFDQVRLVEHTGDARFPDFLPYNWVAVLNYSERSTAIYHGMNTDYFVELPSDGSAPYCETTGRGAQCQIQYRDNGYTVIMG